MLALLMAVTLTASAQNSTMTDDQIADYVVQQNAAGVSRSKIVTQLMQRGVTIERLRQIERKYKQQQKNGSLNAKDIAAGSKTNRLRTANGDRRQDNGDRRTSQRVKDNSRVNTKHTYDDNDEDYVNMDRGIDFMMPDSLKAYGDDDYEAYLKWLDDRNRKKVFGRDIFNNKDLTFEPAMNIATPQNYRLGPGDEVNIDVYGASSNQISEVISPDGTITIQGVGPVVLGGLTVAQAKERLRSQLGARYRSSQISMTLGQTRTITVNVMGEVMAPGTYTISAFASVFHALYMAGGPSEIGTLRNIQVYRNNRLVTTVDVYDFILNGKLKGDVRLADNDVITVGTYDCLVNVVGKVKRPMYYEMKKSETLGTLIRYAGGFTGDAFTKNVRVNRKSGNRYSVYNIGEFDMSSFALADADSVTVDSVIERYSNMVEVKGAVFRPGMYQVGGDITSIRSLIEHADGLTEDAFTAHGVLHRTRPDRSLEARSIDIRGILDGTVPDVALQNEDVLFIPSNQDIEEEKTLTIHGEVLYPGVYRYAANATLEDFIMQAGGLKPSASVMKVDVARRIVNPRDTTSNDTLAHTFSFSLKEGFVIDGEQGFHLQPYDEVYVRKSPGYSEQKNITLEGEVMFEGTYTLSKKSQRLSEIIAAAGGLTKQAYAKGARLERRYTPEELLQNQDLIKMAQMQQSGKDSVDMKKLETGTTYPVGIRLDEALKTPGGPADIQLREGDRIVVPEYTATVRIQGEVMRPTTVAYLPGKNVKYYIQQAGGYSSTAKKSKKYVINMNGTSMKVGARTKVDPGCQIVVPSKTVGSKMSTAEVLAIGTSTASIATMIATMVNLFKK